MPNAYPGDVENQSGIVSDPSSDNYHYDDNGNMIQDLMSDIGFEIYDINNQPMAIYRKSDGGCYQYAYDTQGKRISKRTDKVEYYVNGVDGKTEEIVYGNISKARINIFGNDMIGFAQRNQSQVQRYYYIKDYLGSNRVVVDESGNVKSAEDFGPFGATLEGRSVNYGLKDPRYKFLGKERDVETNTDCMDARPYDSRIKRWRNVDPLAEDYPENSPYVYAADDPINYFDSDGEDLIRVNYGNTSVTVDLSIAIETYRLLETLQEYNLPNEITSSFRTFEKQQQLYNDYLNHKPGLYSVQKPGQSPHHSGLALDANWKNLTKYQRALLKAIMEYYNFKWNGMNDPVHYQRNPMKSGYKNMKQAREENLAYFDANKNQLPELRKIGNEFWYVYSDEEDETTVSVGEITVVEWNPPKEHQ